MCLISTSRTCVRVASKGAASHLLDVSFLFRNYEEFLDEKQAASGRAFGCHFIQFVNGKEPYGAFSSGTGKV